MRRFGIYLALVLFVLCLAHDALAQRTSPTWIGPGPPVGANTPQSTLFFPNVLASWTVSQWYVDPANSTGCASNSNATCTKNTCSTPGDGPCLSYTQIATRWGTYAPRLTQNTTITWLSSQAGYGDPVYFLPTDENKAMLILQGTLGSGQQVATGTLSAVTSKNIATNQLLNATLPAGTYAAGELVVNSTHASRAWLYKNISGTNWSITQPVVPIVPGAQTTATEVNTWAPGDTVTIYTPVSVDLVRVDPSWADLNNSTFDNLVWVQNLTSFDPSGVLGPMVANQWVSIAESRINREITRPVQSVGYAAQYQNSYFAGFISGGTGSPLFSIDTSGPIINSGALVTTTLGSSMMGASFDGDVIIDSPTALFVGQIGRLYIETGFTFSVFGAVTARDTINAGGGTPTIWGPGTLNVIGTGRFGYLGGAGEAATQLKVTTLQLNGQTLGCITKPSSSTITCNTTISAANLDTNLGATSGCIGTFEGGAFCNYGP